MVVLRGRSHGEGVERETHEGSEQAIADWVGCDPFLERERRERRERICRGKKKKKRGDADERLKTKE